MKKLWKKMLVATLLIASLFVFTAPALAAYDHYVIYVYKDTGYATAAGGYTQLTSGVRYIVFDGGGGLSLSSIYSDSAASVKSNPVEATTFGVLDRIDFYIADTTTSVDIAIMDLTGYSLWLRGATTSTRTAIIDERPGLHASFADWAATKASMIGLTGAATDVWTFESDVVLLPMYGIEVITASCACDMPVLLGNLANTAGALFGATAIDAAKTFSWISTGYTAVGDSTNIGSVFATSIACAADGGTYERGTTAYLLTTGQTMDFSGASLVETGAANTSITTDLENGWGFYHFWFIKLR